MVYKTREDFLEYLKDTLIPDLKEEGRGAMAEDFQTAIEHIEGLERSLERAREMRTPSLTAQKLRLALKLLYEIEKDWNEDEIEYYPAALPSFDELLSLMAAIEFKR